MKQNFYAKEQPGSDTWFSANDAVAREAMMEAGILYGTVLPDYQPPAWKTCPDHQWIKLLLEDVARGERLVKAKAKDICIR